MGWIPHRPSPKQLRFLLLPDLDAFYGGAAGGGKSDALLMACVMFAHIPTYASILFRVTLRDHELPEGLIPRSKEWWWDKAKWRGDTKTWEFETKVPGKPAKVAFGYMRGEDDHLRYQSSAYQTVCFDESPQHREYQFEYLFSRIRRTIYLEDFDVPLRMRSAGNPDGPGVMWVKRRYVDPMTAISPFIPARIADNPGLDQESYIKSLMHLRPVIRARLMEGDWEIKDVGLMFNRSWFATMYEYPFQSIAVRYWDKASTKESQGKDPAYTAGALLALDQVGRFYILDMRHFRGTPLEVEAVIKQTAALDRMRVGAGQLRRVVTYLEQEPGSSGVDVIDHYTRIVMKGYEFYPDKVTGSKADRAAPLSSTAEGGNVFIVVPRPQSQGIYTSLVNIPSRRWDVNGLLDELEAFPEGFHKDRVDALSGAHRMLSGVARKPKVRSG